MIVLHQFKGSKTQPNYSPYCLKLETFLRLSELPYKVIGDSTLIIDHLKSVRGPMIDAHLSPIE